jgi:hypothetical protein
VTAVFMDSPDELGRFGEFGGRFVPEALMPACLELEAAFLDAWSDPGFLDEFHQVLREFGGRPTPVTYCPRLSQQLGLEIYLKREDLAHTGSHQDQQRRRSSIAHAANGQEAHDCRDRCRPTRRGVGHRGGTNGPILHGLHGRSGYPTTGAQRLSYGVARRDRSSRH